MSGKTEIVLRWAGAFLVSILLSFLVGLVLFAGFVLVNSHGSAGGLLTVRQLSEELKVTGDTSYELSATGRETLEKENAFAFVLDPDGDVIWAYDMPDDLQTSYTVAEVASFSRWFLNDYPVRVWRVNNDLLVVGSRRMDVVKYNSTYFIRELQTLIGTTIALIACLMLSMFFVTRTIAVSEQRTRNLARCRWIDGISHDIRTPLSTIMGYAGQWQHDASLPERVRDESAQMVYACESVTSLVSDLNLTMRLDYEMQPLQKEQINLPALVRETVTELVNGGQIDAPEIEIAEDTGGQTLFADRMLMKRALNNLLINANKHGDGNEIHVHMRAGRRYLFLDISNPAGTLAAAQIQEMNREQERLSFQAGRTKKSSAFSPLSADGLIAHGNGIRLVRAIMKSHGGTLSYRLSTSSGGTILTAALKLKKSHS